MSRHLIYGRFGLKDAVAIPSADDEVATQVEFVQATKRLDHGIGNVLDELATIGVYPSELSVDLLVLAAHIHAADTRISRNTESQDNWTREIRLVVPVSDVARWTSVSGLLQQMLNFLTGDRWSFDFRLRPKGFERIVAPLPLVVAKPPFDGVSLFSGGLDSLIGAIDALEQGRNPLFVSHAGEPAVSAAQETLFRRLEAQYPKRPFRRLRIWMTFPKELVKGVSAEDSTRGRSFLFFATGAMAGSSLGQSCKLLAPENGLIALNVPLDQLRLGSLSTRTTHPFYIARWNELLRELGIPVTIENPYWDKTKGEMVSMCSNRILLKRAIPESLSCSSPTKGRWKGHGIEHCGFCLPCLIRRAAIESGLREADPTTYTLAHLHSKPLSSTEAEGLQIRSFQLAVARLVKKPGLASILIHKSGPLTDESPSRQVALAGVYLRGMDEVGKLLANVITTPS
ncbi:MAG: Qat anti-phage system QueC-like protein QatC [Terracidiphilus sp.]